MSKEAKNEQLFEHLLLEHQHQVYGFILALVRNQKDAEDIFQDVCVVLWERFDTFTLGTNFVAWASTVACFRVQKFFVATAPQCCASDFRSTGTIHRERR
ncbi:MAG: RNA polymerase sigma-70 factor (ECF subfamily) [Rhodothermales bacterium]